MSLILKKSHDCWGSPRELFDIINREFKFDLDAAATQEDTLCDRFISPEQNALVTPWEGSAVWVNPPYSLIGPFVQRGYEQSVEQRNTVVMLLPAYSDPKYWANYVMKAHEVRFLKGRLKFRDNLGTATMSARYPSVVVVFKWITGEKFGYAPHQWVWQWR